MKPTVKIGTRASKLALWQANWVKSSLEGNNPAQRVDLVTIKTKGDKILDVPLAKVGGKGLFVKEIEQALLDHRIDIAVHSMKDMPAEIPAGLCIGAIPQREVAADVLITRGGMSFKALRRGAVIGTSSLRRAAQLRHARPDIEIVPLRGNLDTRLKKLQTENLDAIVLAAAGVKRLALEHCITEYLDSEIMLPAVGQGALCIEIRQNDSEIEPMVASLNHPATRAVVRGERAFLNRLGGSCQVPIAGHGEFINNTFHLTGLVANLDGSRMIKSEFSGAMDSSEAIGISLAEELLSRGADRILQQLQSMESVNDES
ncbi:MAG: hydroxymethylbilane synthase [Desulfobacterales bacterium]|nr:MAG: hydroxymethylbilane synthase [Desulfobacterales bacterium]